MMNDPQRSNAPDKHDHSCTFHHGTVSTQIQKPGKVILIDACFQHHHSQA